MNEQERLAQLRAQGLYGVSLNREWYASENRLTDKETAAFEAGWEAAKEYVKKETE